MHAIQPRKLNEQLFNAIQQLDENQVKALLEAGADVNAPNDEGHTPLYFAIEKGQISIAKVLLENGADVNAPNDVGNTPLDCAIRKGQINLIKVLLENGADVNAPDNLGNIPLYNAILNCQIDVIKFLLKNGADVNAGNIWMADNTTINPKTTKVYTFMLQYIETLNIAGLTVSPENLQQKENFLTRISYTYRSIMHACHEHSEACKAEVEKMQQETIGESDISYHQFLLETDKVKLVGYLSNPDVREELEKGQYKEKYPLYADLIESQYEKGMKARELVVGCEKILQKAVPGQYLSEDIIHKLAEKMVKSEVMSPEVKNFIRREEQKRELAVGCEKTLQKGIPDQYLSEDTIHKLAEKMVKSEVMSPEVKNFIRREGQKID